MLLPAWISQLVPDHRPSCSATIPSLLIPSNAHGACSVGLDALLFESMSELPDTAPRHLAISARFRKLLHPLDRHFCFALLLAAIVIIPRSALIIRAHSDYYDDQYHLVRGMRFIADKLGRRSLELNDPPLGEALTALPVWWSGIRNISGDIVYGQRDVHPETLRMRIAIFKG